MRFRRRRHHDRLTEQREQRIPTMALVNLMGQSGMVRRVQEVFPSACVIEVTQFTASMGPDHDGQEDGVHEKATNNSHSRAILRAPAVIILAAHLPGHQRPPATRAISLSPCQCERGGEKCNHRRARKA